MFADLTIPVPALPPVFGVYEAIDAGDRRLSAAIWRSCGAGQDPIAAMGEDWEVSTLREYHATPDWDDVIDRALIESA